MADSVIQESLSRGANDNVTAILVDLRPISRKEATSREVTVVDTASVEWKTKNIRR
jgi:serine/threonine protein phosphatase PrpC